MLIAALACAALVSIALIGLSWPRRDDAEVSAFMLLALGTALWSLHTTLPSRTSACALSHTLLDLRRNVSTALNWCVSGQIHGAVSTLSLFLYNCSAFVRNECAVWPVTTLELRENQHTFVADFE